MFFIDELFKQNKRNIESFNNQFSDINSSKQVSSFTYCFVSCTLAEALQFDTVTTEYRHITDARKSGEGAGLGTGLPAFYDVDTSVWCDFMGNPIQV